jgi:hypothetical protein
MAQDGKDEKQIIAVLRDAAKFAIKRSSRGVGMVSANERVDALGGSTLERVGHQRKCDTFAPMLGSDLELVDE